MDHHRATHGRATLLLLMLILVWLQTEGEECEFLTLAGIDFLTPQVKAGKNLIQRTLTFNYSFLHIPKEVNWPSAAELDSSNKNLSQQVHLLFSMVYEVEIH